MTKICSKCKIEKPLNEFSLSHRGKYHKHSRCKSCYKKYKEKRAIQFNISSYSCHICGLSTKQLNGLMSRHYKKHCNDTYTKEQYKKDLLIANGRKPNICPYCNKETYIPKGESEYLKAHGTCYRKSGLQGKNNSNYRNALDDFKCFNCGKPTKRYKSQQINKKVFCSTSCSAKYYSKNPTEAINKAKIDNGNTLRNNHKNPAIIEKMAKGRALAYADGRSKLEKDIFLLIKTLYSDAEFSVALGPYTIDILIPSISTIIEVQGNYWHSIPHVASSDQRKRSFLLNRGYNVKYIWEYDWHSCSDKYKYIEDKMSDDLDSLPKINVILIAGTAGSGKSWVCKQLADKYHYIEYDKTDKKCLYDTLYEAGKDGCTVLVDPHNGISTIMRRAGNRFNIKLVCIVEDATIIARRLENRGGKMTQHIEHRIKRIKKLSTYPECIFSGTSDEVLNFLKQ